MCSTERRQSRRLILLRQPLAFTHCCCGACGARAPLAGAPTSPRHHPSLHHPRCSLPMCHQAVPVHLLIHDSRIRGYSRIILSAETEQPPRKVTCELRDTGEAHIPEQEGTRLPCPPAAPKGAATTARAGQHPARATASHTSTRQSGEENNKWHFRGQQVHQKIVCLKNVTCGRIHGSIIPVRGCCPSTAWVTWGTLTQHTKGLYTTDGLI